MTIEFTIGMQQWEGLSEGSAEERACFGLLCFRGNSIAMTEGIDGFVSCSRPGPLVSGYPLAEWLAWNWWRLTTEPRQEHPTSDWAFAHRLSTIGDGYLWPNITIFSDRERTALIAKPTHPQGFAAFRFTASYSLILPTHVFETALDFFMAQIQGKLRESTVSESNFDRLWAEVRTERADPALTARRRIEALLGIEPDAGNQAQVEQLLTDSSRLGPEAVQELAANHRSGNGSPTAEELVDLARVHGIQVNPRDRVWFDAVDLPPKDQVPAWQRGYQAAATLRQQQQLGQEPLGNQRLAELCGISGTILQSKSAAGKPGLSFSLGDENDTSASIVLRPKWETNRRFDLARLLGDQVAYGLGEPLSPTTDSSTYRQKFQRAFAAELLCPFEALEEMLGGNYSPEARDEAAYHFKVSERTVTTLLVNRKRLDPDYLEDEAAYTPRAKPAA